MCDIEVKYPVNGNWLNADKEDDFIKLLLLGKVQEVRVNQVESVLDQEGYLDEEEVEEEIKRPPPVVKAKQVSAKSN